MALPMTAFARDLTHKRWLVALAQMQETEPVGASLLAMLWLMP
jgi:hypothetical protein